MGLDIERTGIVAEGIARREKYAKHAYVAPQDRVVHVQPKPAMPQSATYAATARLAELNKQIGEREAELDALKVKIAAKRRELTGLNAKLIVKHGPQIIDVQEEFCRLVCEAGYEIEKRPYTFNDLVCKSNQHPHVEPRHICMDLVRRICAATLADIARAFNYRDHTSAKYALCRAPVHMAAVPMLAEVHAKVLAHFEAKQ